MPCKKGGGGDGGTPSVSPAWSVWYVSRLTSKVHVRGKETRRRRPGGVQEMSDRLLVKFPENSQCELSG